MLYSYRDLCYNDTSMLKIINAYLLFLLLIGLGLGYIHSHFLSGPNTILSVKKDPSFTPLFYKSIGQIPTPKLEEPSSDNAVAETKYTLEFQTVPTEDEAKKQISLLKGEDGIAYYTPIRRGDRTLFVIRKGIFTDKAEALRISEKIKSEKGFNAKVEELL